MIVDAHAVESATPQKAGKRCEPASLESKVKTAASCEATQLESDEAGHTNAKQKRASPIDEADRISKQIRLEPKAMNVDDKQQIVQFESIAHSPLPSERMPSSGFDIRKPAENQPSSYMAPCFKL